MSIQRTPPSASPRSLTQHVSDPNLYNSANPNPSDEINITTRSKRRREEEGLDQMRNSIADITKMLAKIQSQQDSKLECITSTLTEMKNQNTEMKNQNTEIKQSIEFLASKYDEVILKLDELQSENHENKKHIKKLEDKIEQMERNSRLAAVEIRNIPKKTPETKQTLIQIVDKIGGEIGCSIKASDIREIFRMKSKTEGIPPIIVDFTTTSAKEALIKSLRTFNKDNTHDKLKYPGYEKPIYISEYLSTKAKRLYYLARMFAKDNGFNQCWTNYGKVYLREKDGMKQIRIDTEDDLSKLKDK